MGMIEETGFAGEELNHLYGYVGQNPLYWYDPYGFSGARNESNPSNKNKHEEGNTRRARDQGGEKGDKSRRHQRKRPDNYKGPWPPRLKGPFIVDPIRCTVFPKSCNPCYPFNCEDVPPSC